MRRRRRWRCGGLLRGFVGLFDGGLLLLDDIPAEHGRGHRAGTKKLAARAEARGQELAGGLERLEFLGRGRVGGLVVHARASLMGAMSSCAMGSGWPWLPNSVFFGSMPSARNRVWAARAARGGTRATEAGVKPRARRRELAPVPALLPSGRAHHFHAAPRRGALPRAQGSGRRGGTRDESSSTLARPRRAPKPFAESL